MLFDVQQYDTANAIISLPYIFRSLAVSGKSFKFFIACYHRKVLFIFMIAFLHSTERESFCVSQNFISLAFRFTTLANAHRHHTRHDIIIFTLSSNEKFLLKNQFRVVAKKLMPMKKNGSI